MSVLRRLALLFALAPLAVPVQAQWQPLSTMPAAPTVDRLKGGSGFLLRYSGFGDSQGPSCPLTISRDGGLTFTPTGYAVPKRLSSTGSGFCPGPDSYFDTAPTGDVLAYLLDPAGVASVFRTSDGVTWIRLASVPAGEERLYPRFVGSDVVAHPNADADELSGRSVRLAAGASVWTDVSPVPFSSPNPGTLRELPAVMGSVARPGGGQRVYARSRLNGTRIVYTSDDLQTWTPAPASDSLGTRYFYNFGDGEAMAEANPVRIALGAGSMIARYSNRLTTGGEGWRNGFAFTSFTGQVTGGDRFIRVSSQTALGYSFFSNVTVWLTTDRGRTWAQVDARTLEQGDVSSFFQTDGRYLFYIDSNTRQFWRRPLADYGLATASDAAPGAEALGLAAVPNPARTSASLQFTLDAAQTVRVTLTDVLGREALRLDRALGAGAQAVPFDVSGLAPGLYIARLTASGTSASVRFVVAR